MWFMAAAYALPVVLLIWFVLRLFLTRIQCRTAAFFIFMGTLVYWLAFIAGCASSFLFEPDSYFKSMEPDMLHLMSFWDAYDKTIDDNNFYRVIIYPYMLVFLCYKTSFYILFTHFTLWFAFFYAMAAFCMFNWAKAAFYAWLIRNPRWGFGRFKVGSSPLEQAFAWRNYF